MFKKKKIPYIEEQEIYDELLLDRRGGPGGRRRGLSYMQAAMGCFGLALLLFLLCIVLSVSTGGDVALSVAVLCILSLLGTLAGVGITIFGHFFVGIEGKMNWKTGLFSNLILALLEIGIFVLGVMAA